MIPPDNAGDAEDTVAQGGRFWAPPSETAVGFRLKGTKPRRVSFKGLIENRRVQGRKGAGGGNGAKSPEKGYLKINAKIDAEKPIK